jgi:nucleotide-binding universal stress UspA family protein
MSSTAAKEMSRIVVVVGVDLTDVSAHLLDQTAALVRAVDEAEIHVVHVVKREPPYLRVARPGEAKNAGAVYRIELAQEVVALLCASLRRTSHTRVIMHTPVGDPATQLALVADEVAADLLVVEAHAHHGHGPVRVFHRSTMDRIARIAPCTVLAIRKRPTTDARAATPSASASP